MMRSAPSRATAPAHADLSKQFHAEQASSASSAPIFAAKPAAPSAQSILPPTEPLFAAIEQRNAAALRQALGQSISPNARIAGSNPALTQAVIQRWPEGVRILLAAGADRNAKNNKGHTASDVALELGYSDMAELLAAPR
jgi:ankyrin repeat protein